MCAERAGAKPGGGSDRQQHLLQNPGGQTPSSQTHMSDETQTDIYCTHRECVCLRVCERECVRERVCVCVCERVCV